MPKEGTSSYVYVVYTGEIDNEYGVWYMTSRQDWTKDKFRAHMYNRNVGEKLAAAHNAEVIDAWA